MVFVGFFGLEVGRACFYQSDTAWSQHLQEFFHCTTKKKTTVLTASYCCSMSLPLQRKQPTEPQSLQSFIAYRTVTKATKPENWVTSWGSSGLTLLRKLDNDTKTHTHTHTHTHTPESILGLKEEQPIRNGSKTNRFTSIHTHTRILNW